jgi:hypothetical protein
MRKRCPVRPSGGHKKTHLLPWQNREWCIPQEGNAEFVAPLEGWRRTEIREQRRRKDWAEQVKKLAEEDEDFPNAEKILLVMDNLNTHSIASLYETCTPDEAKRIKDRLEIHYYTPKHGRQA